MHNFSALLNHIAHLSLSDFCYNYSPLVRGGERAFARGMVKEMYWMQQNTTIVVVVKSKQFCKVAIRLEGDHTTYACDCDQVDVCPHIVSAIVALKHLVSGQFRHHAPYKSSSELCIVVDIIANHAANRFELTPKVYYHDKRLSTHEWQTIASNGGVWLHEHEIVVADTHVHKALLLLMQRMNEHKSRKKIPRLRVFDLIELRTHGVQLIISEHDEELLQNLSHFTQVPKIVVPKKLHATLRDYQKEGYHWLAFLYQQQVGACLADDMGLGKTVQALALLGAIHEGIVFPIQSGVDTGIKPHLIVVPASLVFNWFNEIKRFYPDFKVQEYRTTQNEIDFSSADIFITTYDIVRRDSKRLRKVAFNIIIFDEAQALKNSSAMRTKAASLLRADFRLCITGTPLENHVGEYHSIIDIAIPGLLSQYNNMNDNNREVAREIIHKTRPFILRRTKEIIMNELPEKIESDVYFYMTKEQRAIYTKVAQGVRTEIENAYKTAPKNYASIIALTALLRLRQICISPDLIDPEKKRMSSPKIDYLMEQLPNLIADKHAVLIFSQFTACLDIIERELQERGIKCARIDGSVDVGKRQEIIDLFQKKKKVDVLLMSLKTGGVGLNLTRASYVFHVDPWWNTAVENQASDRAYRLGQKNTVVIIRLLMYHSIEEKMLILKKRKAKLFKAIVEGAGHKEGNSISHNDFDFLLG